MFLVQQQSVTKREERKHIFRQTTRSQNSHSAQKKKNCDAQGWLVLVWAATKCQNLMTRGKPASLIVMVIYLLKKTKQKNCILI